MNPVGFVGWGTTWFESFGYRAKTLLDSAVGDKVPGHGHGPTTTTPSWASS